MLLNQMICQKKYLKQVKRLILKKLLNSSKRKKKINERTLKKKYKIQSSTMKKNCIHKS